MSPTTNESSLLSQRHGPETINYYASSPLNRYSFLRSDDTFLSQAISSPCARFVVFNGLDPLVDDRGELAYFSFRELRPLLGGGEGEDGHRDVDCVFPCAFSLVVFLGLAEAGMGDGADGELGFDTLHHHVVQGRPYFAVDVTSHPPHLSDMATSLLNRHLAKGFSILYNPRSSSLSPESASIFAQARSIIDWNKRNPFCAACGHPTTSVEAGYKRKCPNEACATHRGVSNICFPRSDPTMIAAVVSADGKRILLGRQARYPARWYSCLAGFLELGESVEDAVRREVWEEAGVKVGRVVIHSTQPWPYPASLMIGAIAEAVSGGEEIVLNDKELETADWFTLDEVRQALDRIPEGHDRGTGLRVPPPTAIANRLLTAVVQGFLTGIPKI
ncbi:hypothetical protein L249_2957 [Ophiocordyceps polyrhachis-furcata BCC 54312]|uniref:NAD(+) diphosphatase n=1 Tax=Ophiocordyceps polyrhachis-furcata BCC 54312 TaxID=1330021 RepID=A0A367LQ61_9HYPO|nr:hypothetical protein L249_2957 [Ophiocordyceps polyrhachis-furcata BCC 54312]